MASLSGLPYYYNLRARRRSKHDSTRRGPSRLTASPTQVAQSLLSSVSVLFSLPASSHLHHVTSIQQSTSSQPPTSMRLASRSLTNSPNITYLLVGDSGGDPRKSRLHLGLDLSSGRCDSHALAGEPKTFPLIRLQPSEKLMGSSFFPVPD